MPAARITGLRNVPTKDLVANRANVRGHLDGIDELAASIRTNGILQPLIVNDNAGDLVVTDGHRRLAAAQRAGVPALPCLITTDADQRQVVTTMLAAAMHKELKPIEQARAFAQLRAEGVTVANIAAATGYSYATVKSGLLLLDLPREAQDMVDAQQMTLGQATDLAKQVKAKRTGSAPVSGPKSKHLYHRHRLAGPVRLACTHDATRVLVGGILRADERARSQRDALGEPGAA